jgi:hypothetical protein
VEIEEDVSTAFVSVQRVVSYPVITEQTVTFKVSEQPELLTSDGAQLLNKLNVREDTIKLARDYPNLVSASHKTSFAVDRKLMCDYIYAKLGEAGLEVSPGFKFKSGYELSLDIPYFHLGLYARISDYQLETSIAFARESNSYKNKLFLDFKNKRYFNEYKSGWSSQPPTAQAANYRLSVNWTKEDLEAGKFSEIEGKITNMLDSAVQAVVEADSCAKVTPGQRGKTTFCKSCDFQFSCISSRR